MVDNNKEKFYPGKRVEVRISLPYVSCWFRGTATEPRTLDHQGKVRVWLDQLPSGWTTQEVLFSPNNLFGGFIQPLNQQDRIITPLWELNAIFFFSAPVLVTDGIQSQEGVVIKPPTDESPKIGVRFLKGRGEKEFPYHSLIIERIYGREYNQSLSDSYLV